MCDFCLWVHALELAEELSEAGSDYGAEIREWIETNEHVTDAQLEALERTAEKFNVEIPR
jgi:hypothetical protein